MIPDASMLVSGDVLGYSSSGVMGDIIRRTGALSHVEIYEGNGFSLASRDGLGVARYPLRLNELSAQLRPLDGDMAAFTAWFETVKGEAYSWKGLLGFAEGATTGEAGQMFCSQFIAEGFKQIGKPLFNKLWPSGLVTPSDLLKVKELHWQWADTSKMWI